MKKFLSLLSSSVLLLVLLSKCNATNYCSASLCRGSARHIACNNSGAFAAACARDARIVPISANLRTAILTKHNSLRNRIASGAVAPFQPAVRMATMRWDAELAKLAVLNVKQCRMRHDACRNTDNFPHAGQNLALSRWSARSRTVKATVLKQIQLFYNEKQYASMQDINSYIPSGREIGHFTQLMQQKATHVGCAILRQTRNRINYQFLACNYAYTNVLSRPVYTSGSRGASNCQTGTNRNYRFLCSINEKYAVKTFQ